MAKKLLYLFFLVPLNLFPHPHTFISPEIQIIVKDTVLEKLKIAWVFDAMTTVQILEVFDTNKNKKLDPPEVNVIRENIFKNLKSYDYFTFIQLNHKSFDYLPINFRPYINAKKRLVYAFEIEIKKNIKDFEVIFKDESIYVAFEMKNENITLNESEKFLLTSNENSFQLKKN